MMVLGVKPLPIGSRRDVQDARAPVGHVGGWVVAPAWPACAAGSCSDRPDAGPGDEGEGNLMKLTHSCIITNDVERLRSFYSKVLLIQPQDHGRYAEFPMEGGI